MRILKWFLMIVLALVLLVMFVGWPYLKEDTKKHSPEKTAIYSKDGMDLSIVYSSPSKKDRVIFGELVPFNEVWRTGANEPTTFTTKTNIKILDKNLAAGTYSIWTKPEKEVWTVMFNEDIPSWGVSFISMGKKTTRDPEKDVVSVKVPVSDLPSEVENFTIDFEESEQLFLKLYWDTTNVKVPISK